MPRHHTEKHEPEAAWEDYNVCASEGTGNDELASLKTKECSAQKYGLERHVTEESSQGDNCSELRVEDDNELRVEDDDELRVAHVKHVSLTKRTEPLSALPFTSSVQKTRTSPLRGVR